MAAASAAPAAAATPAVAVVRLQCASDLHSEFFRDGATFADSIVTPAAPILILAGDIGVPATGLAEYTAFIHRLASRFQHVLVIAGNHEFYNGRRALASELPDAVTMTEVLDRIAGVCASAPTHNVTFMHRAAAWIAADSHSVRIIRSEATPREGDPAPAFPSPADWRESSPGVLVLGCTLWSDVPSHAAHQVTHYLNDYRLIAPPRPDAAATPAPVATVAAATESSGAGAGADGGSGAKVDGESAAAPPYHRPELLRAPPTDSVEELRRSTLAMLNAEHARDRAFIEDGLAWARAVGIGHVVVATHHAPLHEGVSDPKYGVPPANLTSHGFATELQHLFRRAPAAHAAADAAGDASAAAAAAPGPLRAWVYGHTHYNSDRVLAGTRVVANQAGYLTYHERVGIPYKRDGVLEVRVGAADDDDAAVTSFKSGSGGGGGKSGTAA